mmetsp:Transcript_6843/g.9453  ORF Transcript_6843/g.9453 Transcript_6843/m.9453 type:complete len:252 (-) Transcript_6843:160-915(-)
MMLDLQQVLKADMEFLSRTMPPLIVYPGFILGMNVINPIEKSLWGLSFLLVVLVSFLNGVGHTVNCYAGMYTCSFSQSCSGILRLADHHTEILLNMVYSNAIAVTVVVCSALPMLLFSMATIATYYFVQAPSSHVSSEEEVKDTEVEDYQGDNSFNAIKQPQVAFAHTIIQSLMGAAMDTTPTIDIEQVASWTSGVVLAIFTALIFLRTAATTITLCCLEEAIVGVPLEKRHGGKLLRQCFARFTRRSIGL